MSEIHHTKCLIIGSGPAGYTAAIYAARAAMEPILITGMQPGGQLTITTEVENYPGFGEAIQGPWLMEQMAAQAKNVGTHIISDYIKEVDLTTRPFKAVGDGGIEYTGDTLIIATGAQAQWLGLESEDKFQGYGVSGCATCDGFFFKNKEVAVIGGGNTAVEEALYLTNHASKVTLVHRRDELRAEKVLQQRLLDHEKIEVVWDSTLEEIKGTEDPKSVTAITVKNVKTEETRDIPVEGVFIAIGHKPATKLFVDKVDMDEHGYLKVRPGTTDTNIPGVFAAGDVADKVYRQAVTAAGLGCMAALDAQRFVENQEAAEKAA